jgi:ATPase subunit of ABC transporter with duplicated ATPase domains
MTIAEAPRSGDVVAVLQRAVARRGAFSLGPVDLQVAYGDRVALVGPNGSGKTTLLSALLGRLPLESGRQSLGPAVRVGEIDQQRTAFRDGRTVVEVVAALTELPHGEVRTLLAKFGLKGDHVDRAADSLSPGEKTRASLALLSAVGVNCLVLDEPTNHLDLPAIQQLELALDTYEGTLLLVTHDRRLLDAVRITRTVELPLR